MPIIQPTPTTRISQEEFSSLAFEVKSHVIDIHNEFGRFFDERVYKRELADRMTDLELELPVTVTHKTFAKTYQLDVLARRSGLFEFKAAETIVSKHRSQAFNYLLLFGLSHGMIFNMRPERMGSEFVNCHQRLEDLRDPRVLDAAFDSSIPGGKFFRETLMALIHDWGAGLEISLYDEALTHFLGGEEQVILPVPVIGNKGHLHDQKMRLLAPGVAFRLTAFTERLDAFETHARRLLEHTNLKAIQWANITHRQVIFTTIR
ncbi:MAG: GxxExxY protein [Verrucomicrobiaceae bacterium]|nr:GxxExxY protein [Verrucomicrobiaceae bacterium]